MPKKKSEAIKVKIGKRNGGHLSFENLPIPSSLGDKAKETAERYGFIGGPSSFNDDTAPNGVLEDDIMRISNFAEVEIYTTPPRGPKSKPTYRVRVGGIKECFSKDLSDALKKAHRAWNSQGRPVLGIKLEKALEKFIG